MVKLSETGVPRSYYSNREASEGQSIYKCLLKKPETETPCSYYAAQMAVMMTHIWHEKKSYSATTMLLHLKTAHKGQSAKWFELTPLLEGNTIEITDQILARKLRTSALNWQKSHRMTKYFPAIFLRHNGSIALSESTALHHAIPTFLSLFHVHAYFPSSF